MAQSIALRRDMFRPGDRVCVALSGGADSVALLLALHEANSESKFALGIVLSAAHVHHGLRGADADADEAFVRGLCKRPGVPLTVFHVDTAERQAIEREGIEEAARALRYQSLCSLLTAGTADMIATAHTLDDQAETVLMKLLRGAWTEGLSGIAPILQGPELTKLTAKPPPPRGAIVRPLLGVRRAEIEAFLGARSQSWQTDATNQDTALTRNRIRLELMPALRSFNPQVDESLAHVADLARDDQIFWDAELARQLPHLLLPGKPVRGGGRAVGTAAGEATLAFELERLRSAGAALRRRLVRAAAEQLGLRLNFDETAKLLALGGFGGGEGISGKIGSRLELRSGLRAERTARELRLWRQR